MFKRVAVAVGAVALLASAAFAQIPDISVPTVGGPIGLGSWSYFPPKESGGEARVEYDIGFPAEKTTTMNLMVGARYTIISGLEASLKVPMHLYSKVGDGDAAEDYFGIMYMPLGVRYWLMDLGLGFFASAYIPLGTADWMGDPDFDMDAGVQYSMSVTDEFAFGAELKAKLPLIENEDFGMALGLEATYSIGAITPFLGLEFDFGLEENADANMELWLGAGYDINDMIGVDAKVGLSNLIVDADIGTTITIGVSVNF